MKPAPHKRYVALAGLLAMPVLVPLLLWLNLPEAALPGECVQIKVVGATGSEAFSLDGLNSRGGHPIYAGTSFAQIEDGHFCATKDDPLSARGHTSLPDTARVWAVSANRQGGFRLQTKPVEISAGEWVAANLRPDRETSRILFIAADSDADQFFKSRAAERNGAVIQQLPAGVHELAALSLQ